MGTIKEKIQVFERELVDYIENSKRFSAQGLKEQIKDFIRSSKKESDNLSQLYACLLEAKIDNFAGERHELAELIKGTSSYERSYALITSFKNVCKKEDRKDASQELSSDLYGMFYAINDHYSKRWDPRSYEIYKPGNEANPIISQFIDIINTHTENTETIGLKKALLRSIRENDAKPFGDISVAFVGGGAEVDSPKGPVSIYKNDILAYKDMFKEYHDFSPEIGGNLLNLEGARKLVSDKGPVDYTVTMNVVNSYHTNLVGATIQHKMTTMGISFFKEYDLEKVARQEISYTERDEIIAAASTLTKKGGMTINTLDKSGFQSAYKVLLNKKLYETLEQKPVFISHSKDDLQFYQDHIKGAALSGAIFSKEELQDLRYSPPEYLRTDFMVLQQTGKQPVDKADLEKVRNSQNNYSTDANLYDKESYIARPGRSL